MTEPIPARPIPARDPGIAAVLSFFVTGLGQIYNGQILKGLLCMVIQCINLLSVLVLVGFVTAPLFWFICIWDAYACAKASAR